MPKKSKNSTTKLRYSARLLFQYRVVTAGRTGKRRLCEERIITFTAPYAQAALREAKKRARAAQHDYENSDGGHVHFEFVGVLELLCLDPQCEADEVWYRTVERITPMERRATLIPPESELNAIRFHD